MGSDNALATVLLAGDASVAQADAHPENAVGDPVQAPAGDASSDGAPTVTRLSRELLGHWMTAQANGSCLDYEEYVHFLPAGAAETILVDDNFCTPEARGTFVSPASYSLNGRILTLTEPERMQRFPVTVSTRAGWRLLHYNVLLPVAPLRWQSTYEQEIHDAEGLMIRNAYTVTLNLDAPAPVTGEAMGTAELEYSLEYYDRRDRYGINRPLEERSTAFAGRLGPLSVHYGPTPMGQQVEVRALPMEELANLAVNGLRVMLPIYQDDHDGPYDLRLWLHPDEPDQLLSHHWWRADAPGPAP